MNKRHRALLAALDPAATYALARGPERDPHSVPGLALRPRACSECRDGYVNQHELHARASVDASDSAELMIYGRIGGGGWFAEGISAADVAALLREAGPGPLNVRVNSPGGDVFDGVAIHSLLARHTGTVTIYVDGLAASAASFIMLAGDRIVAARNAFVMIHDAMTFTYGNKASHDAAGVLLDKVSDNIADMYAERAGEDAEHWRAVMVENGEDGTWYTGQEALEAGLVDELVAPEKGEDHEDGYEDRTARLLAGWSNLIPARLTAGMKLNPEPREEQAEPDWDMATLRASLKGALA